MKKGDILEGIVEKLDFPNKGRVRTGEGMVLVKNVLPGQKIQLAITKTRNLRYEGRLLKVLRDSPMENRAAACPQFGLCGGCSYQKISYKDQLLIKEKQVRELISQVYENEEACYEGIVGSPVEWNYRNKMEYSFGDEYKDGPLSLGMHKRESFYDVLTVDSCQLVHSDYNMILKYTLDFFKKRNIDFYHKIGKQGYLRHLLVRRVLGRGNGGPQILVGLVTSSGENTTIFRREMDGDEKDRLVLERKAGENDRDESFARRKIDADEGDRNFSKDDLNLYLDEWKKGLLELPLEGKITGILHIINDALGDVVKCDSMDILYGKDYLTETLLGLNFKISVFSFFQTNTLAAEVLYEIVREYAASGEGDANVVFDLYCGTGTISQILSSAAKKVIGVEIVEEAVEAARENAKENGLYNCEFISGDVLKVLDEIETRPDIIVLDPPRDGINPKALKKIIAYQVDRIVYVSCKPTSLRRDLEVFKENGYRMERYRIIDQFPGNGHVESIVMLSHKKT